MAVATVPTAIVVLASITNCCCFDLYFQLQLLFCPPLPTSVVFWPPLPTVVVFWPPLQTAASFTSITNCCCCFVLHYQLLLLFWPPLPTSVVFWPPLPTVVVVLASITNCCCFDLSFQLQLLFWPPLPTAVVLTFISNCSCCFGLHYQLLSFFLSPLPTVVVFWPPLPTAALQYVYDLCTRPSPCRKLVLLGDNFANVPELSCNFEIFKVTRLCYRIPEIYFRKNAIRRMTTYLEMWWLIGLSSDGSKSAFFKPVDGELSM